MEETIEILPREELRNLPEFGEQPINVPRPKKTGKKKQTPTGGVEKHVMTEARLRGLQKARAVRAMRLKMKRDAKRKQAEEEEFLRKIGKRVLETSSDELNRGEHKGNLAVKSGRVDSIADPVGGHIVINAHKGGQKPSANMDLVFNDPAKEVVKQRQSFIRVSNGGEGYEPSSLPRPANLDFML
jgi:hypothetical protein